MKLVCNLILLAALAGCTRTVTVVKEVPVEVKVPVATPCLIDPPAEIEALNLNVDQDHWNEMGTDQREALIGAQAIARKRYGDELSVSSSGCPAG